MSTYWKKLLLGGTLLSALALIAAGCSQAAADDSEEAASAAWTEEQINETEAKVADGEERVDDLEKDIASIKRGNVNIPSDQLFSDVPDTHGAYEEIQYLAGSEIIRGYPDGRFQPNVKISRGQTARMLANALKLEAPDGYELKVDDVSTNNDYYDDFRAMEAEGIMTGNSGKMMPNSELKRSQMAAVLVRAYDLPEASKVHTFTDMKSSDSGFEEINIIADLGITTESGEAFRPNETTSRAQFSQFLSRALDDYFIQKNK
ncbi:S-layer homology domain-containing protein [Alteribacillus sp. HJP-4]|uniref:S-layer homology domain-containing protein n=1 Tax=Alteribacillus sp. HJP-4 TaxID=2775394 RepID=UPI0035CD33AB